ncbi:hypothetical protein PHYSODRAFT_502865 [Phytophthora sojae]|uniref:Uncharacterized protein n=1 Tax=Phytophthora sojae (strain P6497) TaxID=1094619 RepID=G4ZEB7_PHYSP|nr:hypothetical protein PHYSODRAFT_502865 [Phytophthora sojae]EGZ17880.1 hypothetical protein PHYSODRAFT_502865 [Phytophthora sojae]|eukprot:XP_009526938.1 hypothetical protein PHYSODRAFT_502865 [Phytophthora sojae]
MPIAVYPPLPPLTEHDLRLTQETTTRTAVIQGSETRRQVEALVQHAAAAHQSNAEQIGQVQLQQDRLAEQTSAYLQAQNDRQSALIEQQQEMRRQMDEHRHYLEEQYKVLRAAEEAVGLQSQRLESLAEAVQPHLQARWGAFAQGAAPSSTERPPEAAAVTVAAGTNLPVPPIYRGSSKKEKRDFMDSYAIYTRRIKALNQGTQAKFFVMPLSACIEQGTMVRIAVSNSSRRRRTSPKPSRDTTFCRRLYQITQRIIHLIEKSKLFAWTLSCKMRCNGVTREFPEGLRSGYTLSNLNK